jgi:hypothetical protein
MGTFRCCWMPAAACFFAVTTRTPSAARLEQTSSGFAPSGRLYLNTKKMWRKKNSEKREGGKTQGRDRERNEGRRREGEGGAYDGTVARGGGGTRNVRICANYRTKKTRVDKQREIETQEKDAEERDMDKAEPTRYTKEVKGKWRGRRADGRMEEI